MTCIFQLFLRRVLSSAAMGSNGWRGDFGSNETSSNWSYVKSPRLGANGSAREHSPYGGSITVQEVSSFAWTTSVLGRDHLFTN